MGVSDYLNRWKGVNDPPIDFVWNTRLREQTRGKKWNKGKISIRSSQRVLLQLSLKQSRFHGKI